MGGPDPHIQSAAAAGTGGTYSGNFVAPSVGELNEILPQFEVIELLGQGGMGAVYKARQPKLDRFVAIKLLPAFAGIDEEHSFGERFEREARAMAKMNHTHIVTVHDFGETEDGHKYIVMEFVDGQDLHRAIQGGQLTLKHALSWFPQICKALQYAHDHDLIHRDIKPANILINQEGSIKVGDFGLAKLVGRKHETSITRTQMSMGTPDYAAPEALEEGAEVDHRADIYSLGVLFYELLTGKVPRGAWKPPSAYQDVDVRIDQIIIKAMQPSPDDRYQAVGQMLDSFSDLKGSPKVMVKRNDPKPLLTGKVHIPSQKEITQMLAEGGESSKTSAQHKPSAKASSSPRRKGEQQMHPVVVAGIALGSVLVIVGGLLLALTQDPVAPSPPAEVTTNETPEPNTSGSPVVAPTKNEEPKGESMPNRGKDKPLTQEEIARNRGKGKSKGTGRVEKPVIISPEPDDGWVQLLETVSVDSEWFAHARQLPNGGVELKAPDGPENVGRAIFPVEPQQSYEIEMKLERLPGNRAMTLSLPIFGEHVLLVLDGMGQSGSRDRFSGVSSINRLDASFPGNPTHRKSSFFTPGVKKLEVQVLRDGMEVGIIARFNDLAFVNWRGNRAQLMAPPMRGQEKPMRTVARRMFGVIRKIRSLFTKRGYAL